MGQRGFGGGGGGGTHKKAGGGGGGGGKTSEAQVNRTSGGKSINVEREIS